MEFLNEMNDFYYYMSLQELRMMNGGTFCGGISYNSLLYVNVIVQMEQCTVSKIAQALGITKSAVTLKVNELEKQGLLCKTQSTADKRVYYVTLSPEMERSWRGYDEVFREIGDRLRETYSEEQLELFGRVLNTVSSYEWKELKQQ